MHRRQSSPWWFCLAVYLSTAAIGLMLGVLILNEIEPNSPIIVGLREFFQNYTKDK